MLVSRTFPLRTVAAALVATTLAGSLVACGGADTAADTVDTAGVTAVGSGTGAGDSARAGGVPGTFMGDTTRDSILGDSAGRDTLNRPRPGTGTNTRP